jgi:hypothetical protein
MAVITNTSKNVLGPFNAPKTALTAADTLTYVPNIGAELILYNTTGAPVNVTIDGSGGTTVPVPDTGGATFSVAAGLVVPVPANDFTIVRLDTIAAFLKGTVSVTGGTGVVAIIIQ